MAQFLIPSGSKRISQLTAVSGVSGSTSIPLVMGGNTVQVSHNDLFTGSLFNVSNTFTTDQIIQKENTDIITVLTAGGIVLRDEQFENGVRIDVDDVSGDIRFRQLPLLTSFIEVEGNGGDLTINRNLIVSGGITAELINVNVISSSIVYSSGSNIFGNSSSNTHQFTGSLRVSGSTNVIGEFTQTIGSVSIGGTTTFTGNVSFNNTLTTFRDTSIGSSGTPRVLTHFGTYLHTGNTSQTGSISVSGSVIAQSFTGSFFGDGSGLTGVTAGAVDFGDITNKPTLVSGSSQISFNGIVDKPTLVSGSSQITYSQISNIPNGIVSGSSQVSFNGIVDKPTLVSSSAQITYSGISNIPNNIVSSSQQVVSFLPNGTVSGSSQVSFNEIIDKPTLVSGSSQISFNGIVDKPTLVSSSAQITYGDVSSIPNGIVSSSTQVLDYGIFATTGSNTFIGNQIVTGSFDVTGSLDVNDDVKIENGYVVLTRVSQSLEFADDAAADIGGVPLGGLYHTTGTIKIRLV